jgi:glycosyltransferase involved in cell wall biosynthesis
MLKISGTIITYNEEKNIARCIESMLPVCDEIIVLDSLSSDKTKEICHRYDINFHEQKFLGHVEQKNKAIEFASHDYILSLDADEALTQELQGQILKFKEYPNSDALKFNRLTRYVDQWIRNCDWYPDVKVRVWNKKLGHWGGTNPHDLVVLQENVKIKHLNGDLLHYSYRSISDHVRQTNRFTTIAAKAAFKNGVRSNNFKIITRPLFKFLKDYLLRRGFLEGRYGFIICFINALSALLKYAKIKDLQEEKVID